MRRPRALTNCTENPLTSGRIQIEDIEQFIPVEYLKKKVTPSEIYSTFFLPEFLKISVLSVHNYQCQIISER